MARHQQEGLTGLPDRPRSGGPRKAAPGSANPSTGCS
nr:hypothetical protein [Actinoplanes regularis]